MAGTDTGPGADNGSGAPAPTAPASTAPAVAMNGGKAAPHAGSTAPPKWHKSDTRWTLSLFGTAIGAGVLFLPINAGIGGIIPLLIMSVLALPLAFFAHRGLARVVLSAKNADEDLTQAAEEHFGPKGGMIVTILYFLAVYPILPVYATTLTNEANNFIINRLGMTPPARWLLSLLLVGGLILVVRMGQDIIVRVMSVLVYPFIAVLIVLSLYLVPKWNTALFDTFDVNVAREASGHGIVTSILLLIPVIVFSFNHSPIISSFAMDRRQEYGKWADKRTSQILFRAETLMVVVVMFFVFSCALSLSPQDMADAKAQNITILGYLANHYDVAFIRWVAPIVAIVSIMKSFLGHYLGAAEGFEGLVVKAANAGGKNSVYRSKRLTMFTLIFMLLSAWLVAWANPSILGMIETLCGPTIAIILLLVPMWAIHKAPALEKYRGKASNYFVFIMGLLAVGTIIFSIITNL